MTSKLDAYFDGLLDKYLEKKYGVDHMENEEDEEVEQDDYPWMDADDSDPCDGCFHGKPCSICEWYNWEDMR